MALNDAALVIAANAIRTAVTHMQLHSAAPGAAGTTAAVGSRFAVTGTTDADGDITWTNNATITGLGPNQTLSHVSYWSAATAGTLYGSSALSTTPPNDTTSNAAGEVATLTVTETSTST